MRGVTWLHAAVIVVIIITISGRRGERAPSATTWLGRPFQLATAACWWLCALRA
jgi:hypothetical protein